MGNKSHELDKLNDNISPSEPHVEEQKKLFNEVEDRVNDLTTSYHIYHLEEHIIELGDDKHEDNRYEIELKSLNNNFFRYHDSKGTDNLDEIENPFSSDEIEMSRSKSRI